MRPPFVKRPTPPANGFSHGFPPLGARRRRQSVACSHVLSMRRGPLRVAAPTTDCGAIVTCRTIAEHRGRLLCARERMSCPPPVLCIRGAARLALASACQARGRGSPRQRGCPASARQQPARVAKHRGRRRAQRPRRLCAGTDAGQRVCATLYAGASPGGPVSRQAPPRCSLRYGGRGPEHRRAFAGA
jgi:hypothetical protein